LIAKKFVLLMWDYGMDAFHRTEDHHQETESPWSQHTVSGETTLEPLSGA